MHCPICGSSSSSIMFNIEAPYIEPGLRYDILRCVNCDFRFADGRVDGGILEKAYSKSFHSSSQQYAEIADDGGISSTHMRYPAVINAVSRARTLAEKTHGGRLLDIGAGRGYFVKAAVNEGFDAEGVDLSENAMAWGDVLGVKISSADFLAVNAYPSGSFDVVTLWDTLASLQTPTLAMTKISELLKPGGRLVMTVPDGSSVVARVFGRYWSMMIPPVNLGFYSRRSLDRLLSDHGLDVVNASHASKWVSLDFIIRKAGRMAGLKNSENWRLKVRSTWRLPVNMFDILTVEAVRRQP